MQNESSEFADSRARGRDRANNPNYGNVIAWSGKINYFTSNEFHV
jgi:hypothetical protein